jgi:hypothetical protein
MGLGNQMAPIDRYQEKKAAENQQRKQPPEIKGPCHSCKNREMVVFGFS